MANLYIVLVLFSVLFINLTVTTDLKLGNSTNAQLAYVENVKLPGIFLRTRTKNVWYNDENATPRVIKAISAIDLDKSNAKVSVTAGGVGSTFVNIRMKSDKGNGLDFQVQIFV